MSRIPYTWLYMCRHCLRPSPPHFPYSIRSQWVEKDEKIHNSHYFTTEKTEIAESFWFLSTNGTLSKKSITNHSCLRYFCEITSSLSCPRRDLVAAHSCSKMFWSDSLSCRWLRWLCLGRQRIHVLCMVSHMHAIHAFAEFKVKYKNTYHALLYGLW